MYNRTPKSPYFRYHIQNMPLMEEKVKKSVAKRVFKWTGISLGVLLLLAIIVPYIFKDEIKEMVQKEMKQQLLADIELKDFDLTFLSSFPHISARLEGLKVTGTDKNFQGVVLAEMESFEANLNFWSVVGGDKMENQIPLRHRRKNLRLRTLNLRCKTMKLMRRVFVTMIKAWICLQI